MWPAARLARRSTSRVIRAAAGLGRAPTLPDPDRYAQRYAHCDVLVVGAGPAGSPPRWPRPRGARVMLCDEQAEFGGSACSRIGAARIDGAAALWLGASRSRALRQSARHAAAAHHRVRLFPAQLIGLSERLTDHLAEPAADAAARALWQVRAREVVLATGAIERPLVFPGNDRPGIMLAGAARTYLNRYGVRVGSRVVVVTPTMRPTAPRSICMRRRRDRAIADLRAARRRPLPEAARRRHPHVLTGRPCSAPGRLRVGRSHAGQVDAAARAFPQRLDCDAC
jgi:sarcosine oxidase, subunit alpha